MAAKVYRNIDYYNLLDAEEKDRDIKDDLEKIFLHAKVLAEGNAKSRYLKITSGFVTVDNIYITNGTVKGRAIKVNTEELPELMDTENAEFRDVEAGEAEGIIQVAHFVLSLNYEIPVLALESVRSGVHIGTFNFFLQLFAQKIGKNFLPATPLVVRNDLQTLKARIVRIKTFEVAIHKENLQALNELDGELFDWMESGQEYGDSDIIFGKLQFDLSGEKIPEEMMEKFGILVDRIREVPGRRDIFKKLDVYGEDGDNNLRSTVFDLVKDRVKSKLYVPRRERSSSLETTAMFDMMVVELRNKFQ